MIYTADVILPITSEPVKNGAVLVKDGRVASVGYADDLIAKNKNEDVKEFKNALLMSGLVNLHGHLECSSFNFLAKPTPFSQWLGGIIEASRKMQRNDWQEAAKAGVQKYIEAGITCTADITRTGAGLQAIAEMGMPAVIYFEVVGIDDRNLSDLVVDILEQLKSADSVARARGLKIGLSPHSPYTLSSEALNVCSEISKEYDLPLSIHLAETRAEVELVRDGTGPLADTLSERLRLDVIENGGSGKLPAQFLDGHGLLRDSLIAAHGVWLSDAEIELMKERGVAVAVCPTSNELLKTGDAPVSKFIEHGLRFGIGTDSVASNPEIDLLLEARKARSLLEKQPGSTRGRSLVSPKEIIKMITIDAANLLGYGNELGSIEPGKRADFVIVGYDDQATDPYDYLATNASKSSVSHTVLAGKVVHSRT